MSGRGHLADRTGSHYKADRGGIPSRATGMTEMGALVER